MRSVCHVAKMLIGRERCRLDNAIFVEVCRPAARISSVSRGKQGLILYFPNPNLQPHYVNFEPMLMCRVFSSDFQSHVVVAVFVLLSAAG